MDFSRVLSFFEWLFRILFAFLGFECHKFAWFSCFVAGGIGAELGRQRLVLGIIAGAEGILTLLSIYLLFWGLP